MMSMANTEIQHLKKRITKLEQDLGAFASLLIHAGIVEVVEVEGQKVYRVNPVKLK